MSNEEFNTLRKKLSKVRDEIAESEFYDDPCCVIEKLLEEENKLVDSLSSLSPGWEEKEKLEIESFIKDYEANHGK